MGTPEFAVEPLKRLLDNNYPIAAVVTVADKPAGRGLKVQSSPVKQFAEINNIPVLQPLNLSDPDFVQELKNINANLYIVVAFKKLPKVVWQLPELGCFNLHASLLPDYRGAAPINHAVINGESKSGVTTFFINDEIDTGAIIKQVITEIGVNETAGELHDKLKDIGADLVVETVESIFNNNYSLTYQLTDDLTQLKKAPKIFRKDCKINWQQPSVKVHNFIRGLSPYPGAFGTMSTPEGENDLKVLKSALTNIPAGNKYGEIEIQGNELFVSCSDMLIRILEVQPSGKKSMTAADYLRGNMQKLGYFL